MYIIYMRIRAFSTEVMFSYDKLLCFFVHTTYYFLYYKSNQRQLKIKPQFCMKWRLKSVI